MERTIQMQSYTKYLIETNRLGTIIKSNNLKIINSNCEEISLQISKLQETGLDITSFDDYKRILIFQQIELILLTYSFQ